MRRIGVLGAADGWYVRDLQRAAAELQSIERVELESLSFSSLRVSYAQGPSILSVADPHAEDPVTDPHAQRPATGLDELDALLVRTMPLGSLEQTIFRMDALHVAQENGTRVINHPRSLEIAIDKWLTLSKLRSAGLPIPRTYCCQSRDDAMAAWSELFERDCVVKPIFGGEGRGIMRVTDADLAWRVFTAIERTQSVAYLQEFVPTPGFDLRMLVIDDAIFCVKRMNPDDWRTNAGRGGRFAEHNPTFEQVDLAFRASKAVGTWMSGVDILPTRDGHNLVVEVNAVPGWKATGRSLGIDLSRFVIERIIATAIDK